MISKDDTTSIKKLLSILGFTSEDEKLYTKNYASANSPLIINIDEQHIDYNGIGITLGRQTTSNFSDPENFVVLECVDRLLEKGYRPQDIELEPEWRLGHSDKSGFADIWVRTFKGNAFTGSENDKQSLLIIECKKWDKFEEAWKDTMYDGDQLFSYFQQEKATKYLCMYTSDLKNGKIDIQYKLINVQDNEVMLHNLQNKDVLTYKAASNNKELYRVWKETYHCEYETMGLFEVDIPAYEPGKKKFTVNDLRLVSAETIQKKYNEFATILRQHNVGALENAFDKLVNLFLAKIVDETNNPNDLRFYWKGSAYDDDYQLQDRLQKLYSEGMKRFLNEDVTYIEDSQIDHAFRRFKSDPDATRDTIKKFFRELKFYSDNDFSFISVHNERLFRQNAIILRKVVKMIQDIRLKSSSSNADYQNQFLGDLFEGFLNKGVKQSEGQFFTPMPIVRFLVSSLPLEQIIRDSQEIPSAIDYACGAGHFLTEYAVRIREFVEKYHPDIPLNEYFSHITGIEKEYRLSKVSKVSAFMYGHDEERIVYGDALIKNDQVRDGSYDLLVANPPYSVKGFLDTLSSIQRNAYRLFNDDINIDKNNSIETFFMERAAQLLKPNGVAGIILPVSVLTKGGIYAKARSLILETFNIVAIAQFGSGTFGKTGTNTVILFLRRKENDPADAEHLRGRVESWFNDHHDGDEVYEDFDLLMTYCDHQGYRWDDYQEFLGGNINKTLLETEVFEDYYNSFYSTSRSAMKDVNEQAKKIRNSFVARTKTRTYKDLPEIIKEHERSAAFIRFVKEIEQEKIYYFLLAYLVPNRVVIVTNPQTNAENKKYLGYEWSDSKGNEGIKYLNVAKTTNTAAEGDADDDDTISQVQGISDIRTPLFNPADLTDEKKINTIIRDNFLGEEAEIPEELEQYVKMTNLVNMIDFKRTAFTKEIKTSVTIEYHVESKFDLIPIKKYCTAINPSRDEFQDYDDTTKVSFVEMSSLDKGFINHKESRTLGEMKGGGYTNFRDNDVLIAKITPCMENGKCAIAQSLENGLGLGSTEFHVFRTDNYDKAKYLLEYLNREEVRKVAASNMTGASGHRRVPIDFYEKLPIPNAPVNVIGSITSECNEIDNEAIEARQDLAVIEGNIEDILSKALNGELYSVKLSDDSLFEVSIGRRVLTSQFVKDGMYDTYSANVLVPFGKTATSVLNDFSKPSVLWGIDGDWMVNFIDKDKPFNPTDHCGVIRVKDESVVIPRYLAYPLKEAGIRERFSRANRASTERIKSLTLTVPSIDVQRDVVSRLEKFDEEISRLEATIASVASRKQIILDKYLK